MRRVLFLSATASLVVTLALAAVSSSARETPRYQRSIENYSIPDVVLVNQDGEKVRLKKLVESDKPLIVDFIYGTCTTICPVLSAGFSHLQGKLGDESEKVHLVSITIDPEHDTPRVMKKYLERYRARPGWDFLTGSRRDIDRVMNAFDAYFRDKMDHKPLTFIRSPEDGKWVRLYGLMNSRDFMKECRKVGLN
jgi:protein SCO1/2